LSSLESELLEEATRCEAYSGSLQEDPYTLCLRSEARHWLTVAVGELPPRERQMLALYYYEELTMREVGEVLGVAEARVSQIHSAALIRLRARLQGPLGAPISVAAGRKNGETHLPLQLTSRAA
jgi:RNA polymerase sigma factor (sigma-70 family)